MPATSDLAKWDARIARARDLTISRAAASELLTFYAALAEYQKSLAARAPAVVDLDYIVGQIPGFLEWLRRAAPPDLAASVEDLDRVGLAHSVASGFSRKDAVGGDFLPPKGGSHESASPTALFVVESILQPFVEQLLNQKPASPALASTPMRCPRCDGLPVAAVLREESHGAKRFLLCSLCLTEWECLRIVCPACGEQEFDKLPVYTAEQFPHVRIDACDHCHHYIKSIDLTKDGHADPVVDDIATVSLDLWACEGGYTRVKRNILGL